MLLSYSETDSKIVNFSKVLQSSGFVGGKWFGLGGIFWQAAVDFQHRRFWVLIISILLINLHTFCILKKTGNNKIVLKTEI